MILGVGPALFPAWTRTRRGNDTRRRSKKMRKLQHGINATHANARVPEHTAAHLGCKSGSRPDHALAGTVLNLMKSHQQSWWIHDN